MGRSRAARGGLRWWRWRVEHRCSDTDRREQAGVGAPHAAPTGRDGRRIRLLRVPTAGLRRWDAQTASGLPSRGGRDGDGSSELYKVLNEGIPALIQSDQWPWTDRSCVAPQHRLPPDDPAYAPCETASYRGRVDEDPAREGSSSQWHAMRHPDGGREVPGVRDREIRLDPQRVYLTGLSCGAYTAYEYVAKYGAPG